MENIEAENPNYFKNFRKKISSGDFYAVKQAVLEASKKVYKEILVLNKANEEEANKIEVSITNSFSTHHRDTNEYLQQIKSHTIMLSNIERKEDKNGFSSQSSAELFNKPTVYYDRDTFIYYESAAVLAAAVMLVIIIERRVKDSKGKPILNDYTKNKYLSDVVFNLKGI